MGFEGGVVLTCQLVVRKEYSKLFACPTVSLRKHSQGQSSSSLEQDLLPVPFVSLPMHKAAALQQSSCQSANRPLPAPVHHLQHQQLHSRLSRGVYTAAGKQQACTVSVDPLEPM